MTEDSRMEAIKALMQKAQDEITRADGELKPARVLYGKAGGRSLHERTSLRKQWSGVLTFGKKRA